MTSNQEQRQKVKDWLRERHLYKTGRSLDRWVRSLPYVFQNFNLPPCGERNLMLGCAGKTDGWLTADILPGADFQINIKDLHRFPANSFDKIYASHILEHITCADAKPVITSIHRLLKPGGTVFVVVPNLVNVSELLDTAFADLAIDIIYGIGRTNEDFEAEHHYGYTQQSLTELLIQCGFSNIQEFEPFINDTSKMIVGDVKVSLCLSGIKP